MAEIKRLALATPGHNWRDRAVCSSPPVITAVTTQPPWATQLIRPTDADGGVYNIAGGRLISWFTTKHTAGATISGSPAVGIFRVGADVHASRVAIHTFEISPGSGRYRVLVNGQVAGLATSSGSSPYNWHILDFTAAGGAMRRRIEIISNGGQYFGGLAVATTDAILKPQRNALAVAWSGDLITACAGATFPQDGYIYVAGDLLGWEINNQGIGSTGYLATAHGAQLSCRQRIGDILTSGCDVHVVAHGFNDGETELQAEVAAYLQALRGDSRTAQIPIIVQGVSPEAAGPGAVVARERAIAAAVTAQRAAGDDLVWFIPVATASEGPWLFGTGHVGATNGSGPSDWAVCSDGVHPSDAGHDHLGRNFAAAVQSLAATWG